MKLDKWDALFGFLIAFVESGAKVLTGIALSVGFREANPFMQNSANVLSGFALIVLIIFELFLLLDPYCKLGLSTLLAVVDADFTHDLLLLLHFSEYTTFTFSVVSAILPLFLTAFVLLYERDPQKEELKKRRNWKMFNV